MPEGSSNSPPEQARLLGYASGLHPPASADETDCQRAGDSLVASHGSTLPARCILCGAEGRDPPIKLTFTWDSSFTVTRQSSLQLREKAYVQAYLCQDHRSRWSRARRVGGIAAGVCLCIMVAGMGMAVWSENVDVPHWTPLAITTILTGFAGTIASLFFMTLQSRTLTCSRIQEGYLYLEGASPAFLAELKPVRR
jgi:hypothetical protein